jgi:hypothetical protein
VVAPVRFLEQRILMSFQCPHARKGISTARTKEHILSHG